MTDERMTTEQYRREMGLDVAGTGYVPRERPEEELQMACVDFIRLRRLEEKGKIFMFHVPNEKGSLSRYEMVVRQRMGVKAGVADLILLLPDGRAAAIELKDGKNTQTLAQKAFEVLCLSFGWKYKLVKTLEEFELALVDIGAIESGNCVLQGGGK